MKATVYMRIARREDGRTSLTGTSRPSREPIKDSLGNPLPTVAFAVAFDIPDELFDAAERVIAEISVAEEHAEIATTLPAP